MADKIENVLNDIREKMRDKYSENEINDFINMGERISSKPVLTALSEVIKHKASVNAQELCAEIEEFKPYRDCGYVSLEFNETPMHLNICLSIVDRDYTTVVDIPSRDYINELFSKYDFLKQIAVSYWHTFCERNMEFMERVRAACPDVDFTKLKTDSETKTTLFWDEETPKRVGIFCYYVDRDGKPYYRKNNGKK